MTAALGITRELALGGAAYLFARHGLWGFTLVAVWAVLWFIVASLRVYNKRALSQALGKYLERVPFPAGSKTRCTVYAPGIFGRRISPQIPYCACSGGTPKSAGLKRLRPGQGVVGQCFTTREKIVDVVEEDDIPADGLWKYHVDNWAFEEKHARKVQQDRRAFYALPIPHPKRQRLAGILYLDSDDRMAFVGKDIEERLESALPFVLQFILRKGDSVYA